MLTIVLLIVSNIFMTFAWYGHLKFKDSALWVVVLVSWGIAFFEYCFQVPANRYAHGKYSAAQLKVMQEVITLVVFCIFSVLYLREGLKWNYVVGFLFILVAVFFVFYVGDEASGGRQPPDSSSAGTQREARHEVPAQHQSEANPPAGGERHDAGGPAVG